MGDLFVVTNTFIVGAGRYVTYSNIENVEIDAGGGPGPDLRPRDQGRHGRRPSTAGRATTSSTSAVARRRSWSTPTSL